METERDFRMPRLLRAALMGSFAGITIQLLAMATSQPFDWSEIWALPVLLAFYALFALPFVCFGLLLFGMPLARLLHPCRGRLWVGLFAAIAGALGGKLLFLVVDHSLFFGRYQFWEFGWGDLGVFYGVPTGLAYWWVHRVPEPGAGNGRPLATAAPPD